MAVRNPIYITTAHIQYYLICLKKKGPEFSLIISRQSISHHHHRFWRKKGQIFSTSSVQDTKQVIKYPPSCVVVISYLHQSRVYVLSFAPVAVKPGFKRGHRLAHYHFLRQSIPFCCNSRCEKVSLSSCYCSGML